MVKHHFCGFKDNSLEWWWGAFMLVSYGSWIYNYLCNQCLSPLNWKPQTYRKSLTTLSHNVVLSTPHHERDSNSQL